MSAARPVVNRVGAKVDRPALLCIVPPYTTLEPPTGAAYLLGYCASQGCSDFGFLDLRLGVPDAIAPTYAPTGVFGQSYVMDVPDLPLVLALLAAIDEGKPFLAKVPAVLESYCRDRAISPSFLANYLESLDRYLSATAQRLSSVRFVGCSIWTSNFLTTLLFAAHLKRLAKPPVVVAGGPQVTESTASATLGLRSGLFDLVVLGEGEATLLDVYRQTANGVRSGAIPAGALGIDADGALRRGPARPLLKQEDVPLPAYDQMGLLSYSQEGRRVIPFHLSRGCTDKCTFCSEWGFWQRFRPGDPRSTVDGVKELHRRYRAEYISFTDSLLNGHPGRLQQFAEGMLTMEPKVAWGGFMRAQMDAKTAQLLRRAGCDYVFIGVESMADETLKLMNKRRDEAANTEALRSFLQAGIHVVAGCIPGFPGDPRTAFVHTMERLRALQAEFPGGLRINVEPFVLSPGQPLFQNLGEAGLHGVPWPQEVVDLAPRHADVTSRIFCTVEGENQGLERMGRLIMIEGMQSNEVSGSDLFNYRGIDEISEVVFDFDHLTRGWFLARLKGPSAWIYALLVSEEEKEDLASWDGRDTMGMSPWANDKCQRLLRQLERRHVLSPFSAPPLPLGGYRRRADESAVYSINPLVVARQIDWRGGNQIVIANYVVSSWCGLPSWQETLLRRLARAPRTAKELQRIGRDQHGMRRPLSYWLRTLDNFMELGIVVASEEVTAKTPADVAVPRQRAMEIPLTLAIHSQ